MAARRPRRGMARITRRRCRLAARVGTARVCPPGGFALIAVVLALVGLFGLMSFAVKQRTNEIGIRLAIGSPRSRILTLIISQGMRLTTYGLLIGLAR